MTMEILAKLGGDLHAKLGKSGLVLAVWFDFVCGTSTSAIIAACAGWDMPCRMLGRCRFGTPLDREIGDMVPGPGTTPSKWTGEKQFTYVRYDPDVTQAGLKTLRLGDIRPVNVQVMDSVEYIREIQRIGAAYAQKCVSLGHVHPFCILDASTRMVVV